MMEMIASPAFDEPKSMQSLIARTLRPPRSDRVEAAEGCEQIGPSTAIRMTMDWSQDGQ